MSPSRCILTVLMCVCGLQAATVLFNDTFEDGSTEGWTLENCTLVVVDGGDSYLHGYSSYDGTCHPARLTRSFSTSGWVVFEAAVQSTWPGGMKGFPSLLYTDGARSDTTVYGYTWGCGRCVEDVCLFTHEFASDDNAISFTQNCFSTVTYETTLGRMRATLLEESDKIDFAAHLATGVIDTSDSSITYEDLPMPPSDTFMLVVHVRSEHVWEVEEVAACGQSEGNIPLDMVRGLDEHSWRFCGRFLEGWPHVADFTIRFRGEPIQFGPDELTVFAYPFSSVSTDIRGTVKARPVEQDLHRTGQEARFYDIAGRRVSGMSKGVGVRLDGAYVRRVVHMR